MAKLYVCGIADLKEYSFADHRYFIARYIKDRENILKYGFGHMPNLAPQKELVDEYIHRKNLGVWSKEMFEEWYRPLYTKQMYTHNPTRGALNYIYKLIKNGNDVVLACYCPNLEMCHRRLIGEAFEQLGIEVHYA